MNESLVSFKKQLSGRGSNSNPPYVIRAADLDENFTRSSLTTEADSVYVVKYTNTGELIRFECDGKQAKWVELDVCVNGVPKKMMVLATDPY